MITYSSSDINWQLACNAHQGTSFTPEKRADGYVTGYLADMEALVTEFSQFITPENKAELTADLEQYRKRYIDLLNAYLYSHSRVMSTMITGPANFPVARNQKRSNWADNHRDKWLTHCKDGLERLRKKYDPRRQSQVISSDNPEAVDLLRAKIAEAEAAQESMKAVNAILRKKGLSDQDKQAQIMALGFDRVTAAKLFIPDYLNRTGFPDYALSNNSANIRRMKERITALEREQARRKAAGEQGGEGAREKEVNGVKIVENTDLNRIQLIFPGKPSEAIRAKLKANGFHWSPREGAWQRQLNEGARRVVAKLVQEV